MKRSIGPLLTNTSHIFYTNLSQAGSRRSFLCMKYNKQLPISAIGKKCSFKIFEEHIIHFGKSKLKNFPKALHQEIIPSNILVNNIPAALTELAFMLVFVRYNLFILALLV